MLYFDKCNTNILRLETYYVRNNTQSVVNKISKKLWEIIIINLTNLSKENSEHDCIADKFSFPNRIISDWNNLSTDRSTIKITLQ